MATQAASENAVKRSRTLTERPGGFDFKNIAKWDAWKGQEGKSQEAARAEYVQLVNELANE